MSNGEAYDLLTLSELVSFFLDEQVKHLKTIAAQPPSRSDLLQAHREASGAP